MIAQAFSRATALSLQYHAFRVFTRRAERLAAIGTQTYGPSRTKTGTQRGCINESGPNGGARQSRTLNSMWTRLRSMCGLVGPRSLAHD